MYVQVIEARAADAAGVRKECDRWRAECMPGAIGFLGAAGGVTADGRVMMVAAFADAEAAYANSRRPEQDAWWTDLAAHLDGEATFAESDRVQVQGQLFPPQAGFVQVLRGRPTDAAEVRRLMEELEPFLDSARPDVLGVLTVWHDDGSLTEAVFFTSEADAREGETRQHPAEVAELFERFVMLFGERDYYDLSDPWLAVPTGG